MIKEWVSRFNWWPRPELSGRGNNLIPPPLSHQQEPPTMTTSMEELIARLHYYACEDAEQGNVLTDAIAMLQRDGERIVALEAERDLLKQEVFAVREQHGNALIERDQLRAELAEYKNALASCIEALIWKAGGEPLPDMSIRARSIAINALREGGSDGNAI